MNSNVKAGMNSIHRRKFFQSTAGAVAATSTLPKIVPSSVLGASYYDGNGWKASDRE